MDDSRYSRLTEIFQAVSHLEGEELAAALDRQCGSDEELRRELDELLRVHRVADDLLSPAILEEQRAAVAAISDAARENAEKPLRTLQPDDHIGGYRLIRLLGEGGMGRVYEAEQESPRRRVAVKVLNALFATERTLKRFEQEAALLARVQHPAIAQVYEAGGFARGQGTQPFIAMELVDGSNAVDFARDRKLTINDRLRLVAAICDAVHHAHVAGVIHRDLKPDNILITPKGEPKILDFGVARTLEVEGGGQTLLTETGQILGTLAYMSPEQFSGDSQVVSERSDIYALGVIAFELLAGRLPHAFAGKSWREVARLISDVDTPSVAVNNTALQGDVEVMVAKALDKDPSRRYAAAMEFTDDIRRFLSSEPILARPASRAYLIRKYVRRNKILVGGVAATVIAIAIGSVVSAVYAWRERQQASVASAQTERADDLDLLAHFELRRGRLLNASGALMADDPATASEHLELVPEAERGWEWRHLLHQVDTRIATLRAPPPVSPDPHAFTPDGRRVFATLSDGSLAAWDLATSELIAATPIDTTGPVLMLPDGLTVVVGSPSGELVFVDAETYAVRRRVDLDGSKVSSLGHHSSEGVMAGTMTSVWAVSDGVTREVWKCNRTPRGGLRLAVGLRSAFMHIIVGYGGKPEQLIVRISDGEILAREHRSWPTGLAAVDAEGTRIATSVGTQSVALFSSTLDSMVPLGGHRKGVNQSVFSSRGTFVATCCADGQVRLFDGQTGHRLGVLHHGRHGPGAVAISADEQRLSALDADGNLAVFRLLDQEPTTFSVEGTHVYSVSFSPDGRLLASSAKRDANVRYWDALTGEAVACLPRQESSAVLPRGLDPDDPGSSAPARSTIPRWVLMPPKLAVHPDGRRAAKAMGWRGEGKLRVLALPDQTVLWTVGQATPPSRRPRGEPAPRASKSLGTSWSPDGVLLAVARDDGSVLILDGGTYATVRELPAEDSRLRTYSVAFSPDGRLLATGSQAGTITLWDTLRWKPLLVLRGHEQYVFALDWSPDGTRLASTSGDGTVRVWDSVANEERERERVHEQRQDARRMPLVRRWLAEHTDLPSTMAKLREEVTPDAAEHYAVLRLLLQHLETQE